MKHRRMPIAVAALTLGLFALTGCQNNDAEQLAATSTDEVHLAAFAGTSDLYRPMPDMYPMGSGDSLGQAVFIEYIAWVRDTKPDAELRFATGVEPLPDVD